MDTDLGQLESELLGKPFDEPLRAHYAAVLAKQGQLDRSLEQWKLLAQQSPRNNDYNEEIAKLEGKIALGTAERRPAEPVRALGLVEGKSQPESEQNIVTLKHPDRIRFADIAGMRDIKKIIRRRIIDPFVNPGLFQKFKRKSGGGVLLYGPPGCGKTMIAKAIATECKASFHSVGISDILDMYIGQSESNLAQIFSQARNSTPAVLFFDELDALAYSRSKASSDHTRTLVNEFLSQLDGLSGENDKILVLGATNMPWDIDDAMKRPGRFDRQIFVPPPDQDALSEMLATKLREVPSSTINFGKIANLCHKYSGADMDGLIEMAKDNVLDDIMDTGEERQLEEQDLMTAVKEITPSTLDWLQTARNLIKYANAAGTYKDVAKYLKSSGVS